jgi:hypothetical protein
MLSNYDPAHPIPGFVDQYGVTTYPRQGLTQRQYAEIHLMAGLLSNFEFVAGLSAGDLAIKCKEITSACLPLIE